MQKRLLQFYFLFFVSSYSFAQATWSSDVANILYNKCTSCHHYGSIAPHELMTYTDAFDNDSAIVANVTSGKMPPWPPDSLYQRYIHERILSQAEIDTIVNWFNAGSPSGVLSSAPPPPVYSSTVVITSPDLALQIPTFTSQATTEDEYRVFVLPSGVSTDQFMEKIEVIPGNGSIVHHVQIYTDTGSVCTNLDAADTLPGYDQFGGVGDPSTNLIGTWVPGQGVTQLPYGFGIRLPANAKIILQIHYIDGSVGLQDSTKIRIKYCTVPSPREVFLKTPLTNFNSSLYDGPFFINSNTTKTFHEKYITTEDWSIFTVQPHMHYVGREITSFATTPLGDTIPFVKIDDWEFHWQGQYTFRHPIFVPSGSTLWAEAFYDNTAANTENPNPFTQIVFAGESSHDEMMMVAFNYSVYQPGDENIIMDSSASIANGIPSESFGDQLFVYPNPTNGTLHVVYDANGLPFNIELYNVLGEIIIRKENETNLNISSLPKGIYFIRLSQDSKAFSKKIIKE